MTRNCPDNLIMLNYSSKMTHSTADASHVAGPTSCKRINKSGFLHDRKSVFLYNDGGYELFS